MITGVGIHSGSRCRVWLHAEEGPLRFRRGSTEIPVSVDAVASTQRSVTLTGAGETVATVEHLLAALHVASYWSGLVIEVDGAELPILDGSALPWCAEIAALGEPPPPPAPLVPTQPVNLIEGESSAEVLPGPVAIEVSVDYPHPALGALHWKGEQASWSELLAARTFGFLSEFEQLRAAGLGAGVDAGNAIVYDDSGPLSPLRHADEPVRHKALDLLGDLVLLGRPLAATVRVNRGSHRLHVNLMRHLLASQMTAVKAER